MHAEAVRMLESIEGDLGVVTIAGPYRTGKSSLAGRALLNNPNAFQTGSTINACTKVGFFYNHANLTSSICRDFGSMRGLSQVANQLMAPQQQP